MKTRLRLHLPPLSCLRADSRLPFALLDQRLRVQRSGELPLHELAASLPSGTLTEATLHPADAVVGQIAPPPVSGRHLAAAVHACVATMTLSDTSQLAIAHGPRQADGTMQAAWARRDVLARAWALLADEGLRMQTLIPLTLTRSGAQRAAGTPENWSGPWPSWSLALPELHPRSQKNAWQPALRWAVLAIVIWTGGLLIHAQQLRSQVQAFENQMHMNFRQAFPHEPAPADPVTRTRTLLDTLRQAQGKPSPDSVMPLALAAAGSLPTLAGQVSRLQYDQGTLSLTLRDGFQAVYDPAALRQALATHRLTYQVDSGPPQTWRLHRSDPATQPEGQP